MANSNYTIKASASTVIIDETDASYLSGNLNIVNSSRNQIYYTDHANPYSPDWTTNNLVIRPYLIATNIYKEGANGRYNPDLFNPEEYRTFADCGFSQPIINDIHWFIKDNAGVETELTRNSEGFSFSWTYIIDSNTRITCNDARQLVITKNILSANTSAEIICKYSYYDPYAKISIPQQYNIAIVNLATGLGTSKAIIEAINGNSIYNGEPRYLELEAHYYRNGVEVDLQDELEDSSSSTSVKWFIRDIFNNGWKYLDSYNQEEVNNTTDNDGNNYDVCKKVNSENERGYEAIITKNTKGGIILRIFPDLISGSDSIKLVVTDGVQNNASFNDLIVIYDNTDETRASIHLSNGNRLRKSIDNIGTTAKVVITYKGELLNDNSPLYDTEFDYYWYKYNYDTGAYYNIWQNADNTLGYKEVDMSLQNKEVVKSLRSIYITPNDINKEEEIIVHIVEKTKEVAAQSKEVLLKSLLVSEEELNKAQTINKEIGIVDDYEAQLFTAYELKASRNDKE